MASTGRQLSPPEPGRRQRRWTTFTRTPSFVLPPVWRHWVLDSGSLTQKLVALSQGRFRVRVVRQDWGRIGADEARLLGLKSGRWALIREVELYGNDCLWVTARSLIPARTLTGAERQLRYLGERPLGAFLFRSRAMHRDAMQIIRQPHPFNCTGNPTPFQPHWGRRSVFYLHGKPLLVSEFFAPALLHAAGPSGNPQSPTNTG